MRFTIITVVYNNVNTILGTIQSVVHQDFHDFEHLIIDGSSTDGTLQIIHQNSAPHITLVSEPDNGIYDAMNKGIQLAKGEIIGFLNSDDIYNDTDILRKVDKVFQKTPSSEIVYGDLVYVDPLNTNKVVRKWKSSPYYPGFFDDGHVPPHPSFFIKRSSLVQTGGFNLQFHLAADYELMFRLLKIEHRPSSYLPQVLVRMRLGGKTNQNLQNIKKGNIEIIKCWNIHRIHIPLRFWILRYYRKLAQFV